MPHKRGDPSRLGVPTAPSGGTGTAASPPNALAQSRMACQASTSNSGARKMPIPTWSSGAGKPQAPGCNAAGLGRSKRRTPLPDRLDATSSLTAAAACDFSAAVLRSHTQHSHTHRRHQVEPLKIELSYATPVRRVRAVCVCGCRRTLATHLLPCTTYVPPLDNERTASLQALFLCGTTPYSPLSLRWSMYSAKELLSRSDPCVRTMSSRRWSPRELISVR